MTVCQPHSISIAALPPLGAVLGAEVLTVEGVGSPKALHVVQQAMVDHHGSQCGFCTPGFVMSLVANQLRATSLDALTQQTRTAVIESISGNLCRCTGYRPILDAALAANAAANPGSVELFTPPIELPHRAVNPHYHRPETLSELCAVLQAEAPGEPTTVSAIDGSPDKSIDKPIDKRLDKPADTPGTRELLLAGTTDRWLDITQRYQDLRLAIDITRVGEMRAIEVRDGKLVIGAAVTHTELLHWFAGNPSAGQPACAAVTGILHRFGSPQIRNRGTIGGNIANASPIADWPPLLLAMDATLLLMSATGTTRRVAIAEFYRGYRQIELAADEFIVSIECDATLDWDSLIAYKVSKRIEDDISSTMLAVYIEQSTEQPIKQGTHEPTVTLCRIALGGVAATPIRVAAVEAWLTGEPITAARISAASILLMEELTPISDVRASADYRRLASGEILTKALQQLAGAERDTLTEAVVR